MTSVPWESAVLGYTVFGYKIFGESVDLTPAKTIQDLEIIVFDKDMDPVGRIKNAESFRFTENWYQPHTFELKIDAYKLSLYNLIAEIKTGGYVGFIGDDLETRICRIDDIEKPKGKDGDQWTITGRGVLSVLEQRKMMRGYSTSSGYDAVTGVKYSTAARYFVDGNCITAKGEGGTADANRVMAGLSLESEDILSNGVATADCEYPGRAQTLLDTLGEFSKSSSLSFDLAWLGELAAPGARRLFEFRVKEGRDLSAEVKLNIDLGNVLGYDWKESILGYRNFVYVAGTGDAAARVLQKVYAGTEPAGWDRFEDYIDASDCTTTEQLIQRGIETLAAKAGTKSLDFEFNTDGLSEIYGVDFGVGDTITLEDPDEDVDLVDRVISGTSLWDANGKTITLGMGTGAPDLVSIMKMDRKQNTGVRR